MKTNQNVKENSQMPLSVKNYKLILVGVVMVIIGFFLMSGGGSESASVFNEEMFSVRRIVIAPLVILAGLAFEIYAILKK